LVTENSPPLSRSQLRSNHFKYGEQQNIARDGEIYWKEGKPRQVLYTAKEHCLHRLQTRTEKGQSSFNKIEMSLLCELFKSRHSISVSYAPVSSHLPTGTVQRDSSGKPTGVCTLIYPLSTSTFNAVDDQLTFEALLDHLLYRGTSKSTCI